MAALVASNAEMATLARKLGQLTSLFRQGSARAAHEYRAMLDGVAHEVREHIHRVSAVLADPSTCAARARQRLGCQEDQMSEPSKIDGVLVQWGERLFYPHNRIVKVAPWR